jgi:hypothetical protein
VTLLVMVASPVLSPQYLLWVIGLAAACLASRRTTQRPVALAVLGAALLTVVVFPAGWQSLLAGSAAITGVLAARNALLAAAAAASCWRVLSAAGSGREDPGRKTAMCRQQADAEKRPPAGPPPHAAPGPTAPNHPARVKDTPR